MRTAGAQLHGHQKRASERRTARGERPLGPLASGCCYLAPGHIRVLGLLPDDAEQPAVVRRDGTRQALVVTGNVYVIELHVRPITQQPARIEWTRQGRSDGIDVPIPADVASGRPDGVPAGRPDWWN